jgi:EmrB/QacA subfamily drug resistance transporter
VPTRTVLALVALGISTILMAQDFSALNVALPSIERDLDADLSTVQWVINAYALVFGMVIVTGGRLADQFGRRRLFLVGAAIFAAMSLLAGAAPNPGVLIGARALMGIGGALMWPAILGMTYAVLPERATLAGGLIMGANGVGLAIGPFTGGALTEFVGWRWVQLINVPVALLAVLVIWRTIPADGVAGRRERIDYAGIAALSVGLVALLFALDQATDWGWRDPRIIACLVVAVVGLAAFVPLERRAGGAALIPGDVIGNRPFALACVLIGLIAPAFFASLLFAPQLMEKLLGFSPLAAGMGMLPMLVGFALVSFVAGPLGERLGAGLLATVGAGAIALGVFLLSGAAGAPDYAALVPGLLVTGLGLGLFFPSVTTMGVTALDPARASLAGGIVYMFQLAGGAVGLALTTTIVAASSQSALRAEATAALGGDVPGPELAALGGLLAGTETARAALAAFDPATAARLVAVAGAAFADGVRVGLRLDAALALLAFALAASFARRHRAAIAKQPTEVGASAASGT